MWGPRFNHQHVHVKTIPQRILDFMFETGSMQPSQPYTLNVAKNDLKHLVTLSLPPMHWDLSSHQSYILNSIIQISKTLKILLKMGVCSMIFLRSGIWFNGKPSALNVQESRFYTQQPAQENKTEPWTPGIKDGKSHQLTQCWGNNLFITCFTWKETLTKERARNTRFVKCPLTNTQRSAFSNLIQTQRKKTMKDPNFIYFANNLGQP